QFPTLSISTPVLKSLPYGRKRLYLLYISLHHPTRTGGRAMTPLRQRMIEDLQLRGLSARTQEMYVRAVRQLADHYHKSPDRITEEERRDSFLSLKNVKHYSRAASTIALCGSKLLSEHTLKPPWPTLTF